MEQFYPTKMFTQFQKAMVLSIVALSGGFIPLMVSAQAPSLSYAGPQVYQTNTAITPLSPTSSGVAALGYTSSVIAPGTFTNSVGLAIDGAGNLFLPDNANSRILTVPVGSNSAGTVVGGVANGTGMAVDAAGNLYTCDQYDGLVLKYTKSTGSVSTVGSGFTLPVAVAVDGKGNLFVADNSTQYLTEIPVNGSAYIRLGTFTELEAVAVDAAGNIYTTNNQDIVKIPAGGGPATKVPSSLFFESVDALAVDPAGNIFLTTVSQYIYEIPYGSSTPIEIYTGFHSTHGLAVDSQGDLFFGDEDTQGIIELKPTGGYFIQPALPAGLKFDSATGILSGTPTAASLAKDYTVTAYNNAGSTTVTLNISVSLAPGDATLSAFTISNGTLSPTFAGGITNYKTNVGYNLKTMTITPTATNPSASIMVAGQPVASGSASQYLTLQVGQNTVNTVVTSADGTKTKTYVLTIGEARSSNNNLSGLKTTVTAISPTFAANTTFYTETVNYSRTSITVTPTTADTGARVTVNGTAVVSGTASAAVPLSVGKNTITVVVTAQNTATNTYTILVTRASADATQLSNLTLSNGALSPAFDGTTYNYTAVVGNGLSGMTVTPTAADPSSTITVNGAVVASGAVSQNLPLMPGSNTITIVVTPVGGTGQTYTVVVKEAMSSDANLFSLKTNAGLAVGKTVPTTITENVGTNIGAIKVTPTADDTTAVIRIDEAIVKSGTESAIKYLSYGNNLIFIQVYPQTGQEKDYYLTVNRASPPPADQPLEEVNVEKPTGVGVQNFEPLLSDDGIKVHPGLTPNGDGIDDFLLIENVSNYPENNLRVMDHNGQLVFEAKGYDNATKVFDGHSSKNGRMQLPGTYFYALDYTVSGIVKHKTGFLVLKY